MDDFYNKIKSSVDGISEAKPSQSDWSSFQSFRDEKDSAPAKSFPWLMASTLGLIVLLLGSNTYWAARSMDQTSTVATSTIHDTIYITKVIDNNSTDINNTIEALEAQLQENQISLANQSSRFRSLQSQFNSQNGMLTSLRTKVNQQESQQSIFASAEKSKLNTTLLGNKKQIQPMLEPQIIDRSFLSFLDLPTLSREWLAYNTAKVLHPSTFTWVKNEKPFNLLDAITPKSVSLNINGGFQQGLEENYGNSGGSFYDIRATSIFTNNIRGYIGITNYCGRSEIEDDLSYPNLPAIVVPEGDELKEVKVSTASIGLNIGLEYLIHTRTKFRPHIGLGYAHSLSNKDNFSFELESPQGEYYLTQEEGINQAQLRQMIFSLGTDYNLSANLDLRSAVTYYQGLSTITPSFMNFTGGVYYHF